MQLILIMPVTSSHFVTGISRANNYSQLDRSFKSPNLLFSFMSFASILPPHPHPTRTHPENMLNETWRDIYISLLVCKQIVVYFDGVCQHTISVRCNLCRYLHNYALPSIIGCCAFFVNNLINATGSMEHEPSANGSRSVPLVSIQVVGLSPQQGVLEHSCSVIYFFFFYLIKTTWEWEADHQSAVG